jgi:hypothetical protein
LDAANGPTRAARIKAVQQGTSVNEVCRQALAAFASLGDAAQAEAQARDFWAHAEQLQLGPPAWPLAPARRSLRRDASRALPRRRTRCRAMSRLFFDTSVIVYAHVQAASDARCQTLYSEDLQPGMRFEAPGTPEGTLQVVNPFSADAVHEPAGNHRAAPAGPAKKSRTGRVGKPAR